MANHYLRLLLALVVCLSGALFCLSSQLPYPVCNQVSLPIWAKMGCVICDCGIACSYSLGFDRKDYNNKEMTCEPEHALLYLLRSRATKVYWSPQKIQHHHYLRFSC